MHKKRFEKKFLALVLICLFFLSVISVSSIAVAEDKTDSVKPVGRKQIQQKTDAKKTPDQAKINVGTWDESNRGRTRANDLTFSYYQFTYQWFVFRTDLFNSNRKRYWLNVGSIPIIKSPGFKFTYLPGIQINNTSPNGVSSDQFFWGGHFIFNFPKLGLNILQKSYAGSQIDFNQTFSDLKICRNLDLSDYNFMNSNSVPDNYIGPKLKLDLGEDVNIHVWYGWSLVPQKPDAKLLNIGGMFKF